MGTPRFSFDVLVKTAECSVPGGRPEVSGAWAWLMPRDAFGKRLHRYESRADADSAAEDLRVSGQECRVEAVGRA